MQANDIIRGVKRIAYELGVSESTVKRMRKAGRLPEVTKAGCGGRTSPCVVKAEDLRKARKG